jgi:hypothetical protein
VNAAADAAMLAGALLMILGGLPPRNAAPAYRRWAPVMAAGGLALFMLALVTRLVMG